MIGIERAGSVNARALSPVAALAIVAAAGAFGLASSLGLLHANWTRWYASNEHGYLVLAASLWIAATQWRSDPPAFLRPDWWALLPLVTLVLLLAGLELMFVNNSRLVLLPPLVLAATAFVFGRAAAKRILWPAAFLYFALPQWWIINGLLQTLTARAVTYAIRSTQIPAYIEGNFVHLPAGTFEIASGCSGLSYLQAGTALAAFHGLLYLRTTSYRLALFGSAAIVAVVFNWVRVYLLIVIGHQSDMEHYLIANEHHTFGWVLFLLAMTPLLLLASRFERLETALAPAVQRSAGDSVLPATVHSRILLAAVVAAVVLALPRMMTPVLQSLYLPT